MNSPEWSGRPPSGRRGSTRGGTNSASNTSLIDWDKNVLNYVYACMYPEPAPPRSISNHYHHHPSNVGASFRKAHRRIVSATTSHTFQAKPSRLVLSRGRGHCRNASDPGMHIYFPPPPPLFLPSTTATVVDERERNISNVDTPPGHSSPLQPPSPPPLSLDYIDQTNPTAQQSPLPSVKTEGDEIEDIRCLFPCLKPWVNSLVLLICFCAMAFFQALVSSGYLSSIITTLERRFDLTSRQVGYMYCCYEITGVFSTIGFSFVNARRHNRPRIIGLLGLLLGLGFGLFALPHWLSGPYTPGRLGVATKHSDAVLCSLIDTGSIASQHSFIDRSYCNQTEVTLLRIGKESVIASDYTLALPVFCCAMALAGFGSTSLFVLAPTFFWDNLSPKQYPLYSGLLYSSAGLGPAFGFMAASAFLQIYIDAPTIQPPSDSKLDAYSQSWLGAWWLGMVIFGAVTCLPALPALTFPKRLPDLSDGSGEDEGSVEKGVSSYSQPPTANTTALPTPEEDERTGLPTGDAILTARHPTTGGTIPCRFPEPIPEAAESFVLQAAAAPPPPPPSPEAECRLHRRQASRASRQSNGPQTLPPAEGAQRTPSPPSQAPSKRRRVKRLNSLCTRWGANFARKYLGRSRVFWRVVTNPIWLGVTATTVTENTIVAAYLTYAAKYLQAQFRTPAHLASIHTGAVVVPSAVLGVLTGALLMRHYRPSISRTLLAILVPLFATLATLLILMLGLNCSNNLMAGVTATYDGEPMWRFGGFSSQSSSSLTAACNAVCRVESGGGLLSSCPLESHYSPVCWESERPASGGRVARVQMSFLNPCLAGCSAHSLLTQPDGQVVEAYTNCNCVTNSSLVSGGVHTLGDGVVGGVTKAGVCSPHCPRYLPFLLVTFLTIFLTCVNQNPSNVVTLSCVTPEDSTAALGLQVLFARTLAFIPTPIYFGALMDRTCRVRTLPQRLICESHQRHRLLLSAKGLAPLEGACLEYDPHALALVWLGGVTVFKCLSILIAILTWRYSCRLDARREEKKVVLVDSSESQSSCPQGG